MSWFLKCGFLLYPKPLPRRNGVSQTSEVDKSNQIHKILNFDRVSDWFQIKVNKLSCWPVKPIESEIHVLVTIKCSSICFSKILSSAIYVVVTMRR